MVAGQGRPSWQEGGKNSAAGGMACRTRMRTMTVIVQLSHRTGKRPNPAKLRSLGELKIFILSLKLL